MAISKTLSEAFEAFWAAYPRRPENPKAAARLVFERRVREGADADAIVRAAGVYAQAMVAAKKDAAFIPHARTWLSQRRYEDYFEDALASAPASAEPSPEHPLAWLKNDIGDAAWSSWIAPLQLLQTVDQVLVIARTQFALDHVKREWGYLVRRHFAAEVSWAVQPKDRS
jgi:hypothetical protein